LFVVFVIVIIVVFFFFFVEFAERGGLLCLKGMNEARKSVVLVV
jgi:hypothetical protein